MSSTNGDRGYEAGATHSGAARTHRFGPSVFTEFTQLAIKHDAVNLGQGFPDWETPKFVRDSGIEAIDSGKNQYSPHTGLPALTNNLGGFYSSKFNRTLVPKENIVVTNGATQALFSSAQALLNPGDEAICIEPFFDAYPSDIIMAGGKPVFVPLRATSASTSSQDWKLDLEELENAITDRTKFIYFNNPHNPTGKMYTQQEMEQLSEVILRHKNLFVISDEVYEFITFDNLEHIRIATIPGMWDRTITISSAGKTFSSTGWKVGWAIGPQHLIEPMQLIQQWIPFCVTTPMQHGVSLALEKAQKTDYFEQLKKDFQAKRDVVCNSMREVGINPVVPASGYFALGNVAAFRKNYEVQDGERPDYEFSRYLTKEIGVTTIPPSAFYGDDHKHFVDDYTRFAFCKTDSALEDAVKRLQKMKQA